MSAIKSADVLAYALMNNISKTEAKNKIFTDVNNSTAQVNKAEEYNFTDCFVSSTSTQSTKDINEEMSYYKNIFAQDAQEESVAKTIESFASNPILTGKTLEEIHKSFAEELEISEQDAADIFTDDFLDEVLGIKAAPSEENAVDSEMAAV